MNKKLILTLLIAGFIFAPRPAFAKSFFQNLLESQIGGGSSNNSGGGYNSQDLQDRQQTLMEDQQRLDEAYAQLRQAQASGGDTSAATDNVRRMEQAVIDRKQQVRQLEWQAQRQAQYQQMNQMSQNQANQQQLNDAYYQLRQKQAAGLDTTQDVQNIRYLEQQQANGGQYGGNNGFFGNNSGYNNQNGYQNDDSNDNNGFKFRFGR